VIHLTVPGIPPSGNHYKGLNRRTGRWFVRKPAIGFKADVAVMLAGRVMPVAKAYKVEALVYLPKGKRGDADNFNKVILDALQAAGAFPGRKGKRGSDARVRRPEIETRRDWNNPRTEITITVLNQNLNTKR
jgi:Holliday junction resolvase RusA-like endonuclease